jgi:hypothetical protein
MFFPLKSLPSGAEQAAEKPLIWVKCDEKHPSGAKARIDSVDLMPGMNPWPTARTSFSAACEAQESFGQMHWHD